MGEEEDYDDDEEEEEEEKKKKKKKVKKRTRKSFTWRWTRQVLIVDGHGTRKERRQKWSSDLA